MKRERALGTFILLMVVSSSILSTLLRDEDSPRLEPVGAGFGWALTLGVPLSIGSGSPRSPSLLNSSTRLSILSHVSRNPGVHFRGICSEMGLPVGVAQYHLGLLAGAGFLTAHRDRRYKRYFPASRYSLAEMEVISAMRNETAREILRALLERHPTPHCELASSIEVSSQALTWQMKRLRALGLIEAEADCRNVRYSISEDYGPLVAELMEALT